MPEEGAELSGLLDLLFDRAIPKSFHTAGPGYLAYVPGGGLPVAAIADLISGIVNRYTGVFAAAPALARLEANVLAWFCQEAGYPKTARGLLLSGGSLANFSALVVARHDRLPENFLHGVIYASTETHHSIPKAARMAGFPARNLRSIPVDHEHRMRLDLLADAIEEDRRQGLTPFLVVGNAGTVNTGAIDPFPALADLAHREGLWLHVDGAYGACFLWTEEGKTKLSGVERADSITLDPHKGFFLPYGTGALLVRDGAALERAFSVGADYLPQMQSDPEFVDWSQSSPELSRPYRGLRLWLPFKLYGVRAFRDALTEKLALARRATEGLRAIPEIEVVAEPQLSIVAFRLHPEGLEDVALDELNRRFLAAVNARQRIHLSGTRLEGRFVLRICVLSFRTHADRIDAGLEDLRAAAAQVLSTRI